MTFRNSNPVAKNGLRFRRFPKGVLYENGVALNNTAFAILKLCDGVLDIGDIAVRLSEGFGCPVDELIPHVKNTLELLTEANLINWRQREQ